MKYVSLSNQPVVPAKRFLMRPLCESDAGLLDIHSGDERVARMTRTIPHPLPPGATEAFIAICNSEARTADFWVMDGSASGHAEVMGTIGLKRLDRNQCEIAFWVAPAFWNAGIASEAVKALVAANPVGAETIFGEVFQDNPASARVLTGAGFEYLGDAETFSVARDARVRTWTYMRRLD